MTRAVRVVLVAGALVVSAAAPARAQFVLGPVCPPGFGHPLARCGPGYHVPGFRVAGFAGGFYSRSVFAAPLGPWGVVPPVSTPTPFGWAPGFLPAGWGVGPGWGWFQDPPVVVVPPAIVLAGGNAEERRADDGNPALAFEELPKPIDPLPRGARPGQFIVIRPKTSFPEPGRIAPEVDRVASAPRPRVPVIRFDPFEKRVKVEQERREADPAKEAARLVALGRAAFAEGQYGRAAEQFDRAIASDPKLAAAHFLKAQAAFAAGRYADAVSAIRAGLELDPAWPSRPFDPKELYGARADAFAAHLTELGRAAAANPGQPAIEFLLGAQLWFAGDRAEARKWFAAAARNLADPGPLGLFK